MKGFAQAELPGCEPAFAITIHKSQGSSYDNVLVILPDSENQILSRNLVYTAVTRARKRCLIWGAKATPAWSYQFCRSAPHRRSWFSRRVPRIEQPVLKGVAVMLSQCGTVNSRPSPFPLRIQGVP